MSSQTYNEEEDEVRGADHHDEVVWSSKVLNAVEYIVQKN